MHQHRHGACFVGFGHFLCPHGAEPLVVCEGEPGGTGDAGAGYDQSGRFADV